MPLPTDDVLDLIHDSVIPVLQMRRLRPPGSLWIPQPLGGGGEVGTWGNLASGRGLSAAPLGCPCGPVSPSAPCPPDHLCGHVRQPPALSVDLSSPTSPTLRIQPPHVLFLFRDQPRTHPKVSAQTLCLGSCPSLESHLQRGRDSLPGSFSVPSPGSNACRRQVLHKQGRVDECALPPSSPSPL